MILALGFLCLVCGVRLVRCTYFTHVHLAVLLEPRVCRICGRLTLTSTWQTKKARNCILMVQFLPAEGGRHRQEAKGAKISCETQQTWNSKQPFINGCLVKQPFPSISYVKVWNHPIETTIYKWLALGFQEHEFANFR